MLHLPSPVPTLQLSPVASFSHSTPSRTSQLTLWPQPSLQYSPATSQKGKGRKVWATWDMKIFTSLSWHKVLATGSSDKLSGSPFLTRSAPGRRLSSWPCSDTSACREKGHTLISPSKTASEPTHTSKNRPRIWGGVVSSAAIARITCSLHFSPHPLLPIAAERFPPSANLNHRSSFASCLVVRGQSFTVHNLVVWLIRNNRTLGKKKKCSKSPDSQLPLYWS